MKDKKTKILLAVAFSGIVAVGVVAGLSQLKNPLINVSGVIAPYSIKLSSSKNVPLAEASTSEDLKTEKGNDVAFVYEGFSTSEGNWGAFVAEGYLYNVGAINGLQSLNINLVTSSSITVYWGATSGAETSSQVYTDVASISCIFGYSAPSYFKIKAVAAATISNATISYSCVAGNGLFEMGNYPQSKADDTTAAALTSDYGTSDKLPSAEDANFWTDYGYYIGVSSTPTKTSYMWYKDVSKDGIKYRGVYFTSYRPKDTRKASPAAADAYQHINGYSISTVYWFKFEPIQWRVLSTKDSGRLILSNKVLDGQTFYHAVAYRGSSSNDCSYDASEIRAWLNGSSQSDDYALSKGFYDAAFSDAENDYIATTTVDNSTSSTKSAYNRWTCGNTSDKVFLLSYADFHNTDYGFNADATVADSTRSFLSTDYAECQGIIVGTGNKSSYLTRSPADEETANCIDVFEYDGSDIVTTVNDYLYGTVPAMTVTL